MQFFDIINIDNWSNVAVFNDLLIYFFHPKEKWGVQQCIFGFQYFSLKLVYAEWLARTADQKSISVFESLSWTESFDVPTRDEPRKKSVCIHVSLKRQDHQ